MGCSDYFRKLTLKIFFPEGGFQCSDYRKEGWLELKDSKLNYKFHPTNRVFFDAISSVQLLAANDSQVFSL
jgi:hypothetical protein